MKGLVIVLTLSVISTTGCNVWSSPSPCESRPAKKTAASVLDVPPEDMRIYLEDSFRLQPDRRFTAAVAEVHSFFSGQQRNTALVFFKENKWTICYKKELVGSLPEFPDFKDAMAVLSQWAARLAQKYPLNLNDGAADAEVREINGLLVQFHAPSIASALQMTDSLWKSGKRSSALLSSAARGLTALALQRMDRLETADSVPAKALAILAIAKSATGGAFDHEESLLAYAMAYSGHAASLGMTLPADDGARLFVTRADRQLKDLAESTGASVETRYLHLLRLTEQGRAEPVIAWIKEHFSDTWHFLPVYRAGLDLHAFSLTPDLAETMPRLVLLSLAREVGPIADLADVMKNGREAAYSNEEMRKIFFAMNAILTAKQSTLVDNFETGLQSLTAKYPGPFLDADTYKAYYAGYFFSSLYDLGLHYLDSLSSIRAADAFAAQLGSAGGGTAADFQRWYRNLLQSKGGGSSLQTLMGDLQALHDIGTRPLMRTFAEQKRYFGRGDPSLLKAIQLLMTGLDTRIEHRVDLTNMAFDDLYDLRLAQKIAGSVIESAPFDHESLVSWYSEFTGDQHMLKGLLHSPLASLHARLRALSFLANGKGLDGPAVEGEYERLIEEDPNAWATRSQYARYLMKTKYHKKAREVVHAWQKRRVPTTGLEDIFAWNIIAETYYEEGQYKKGLAVIKPVVQGQQAGSLEIAALLLDKLGRHADAETMANALVRRYPDSLSGRMTLIELYWRHGKHTEAANLLKSAPHQIGMADWRFTIAPKFAEIFRDRPQAETMDAFEALLAAGFDHHALLGLTSQIATEAKHELAFLMSTKFQGRGMEHVVFLIRSYKHLKSFKVKQEALAWLQKTIPAAMMIPAGVIMYDEREYELLWDLIPDAGEGDDGEYLWLVRMAASLRMGAGKDSHLEGLRDHFSKSGGGFYHDIGKYLAGLMSEKDLLSRLKGGKQRCEAAYFIGVKEQSEGRYEDASDWFRISLMTGLMRNGEYRWAGNTLYAWHKEQKSLARLAAEKR